MVSDPKKNIDKAMLQGPERTKKAPLPKCIPLEVFLFLKSLK